MEFQSTLPQGERPDGSVLTSYRLRISIHAPARGATKHIIVQLIIISYFNPRSRKGSDVSCTSPFARDGDFNPRSRKGSDYGGYLRIRRNQGFQSTLPQGERPAVNHRGHPHNIDFNPRSRKGSDSIQKVLRCLLYISIHAPARGATHDGGRIVPEVMISIHAPARGATDNTRGGSFF